MTDKERQTLLLASLGKVANDAEWFAEYTVLCKQASAEIERLQGESDWLRTALRAAQTSEAQPDVKPVELRDRDRKALQSLHWHLINRTENREVLLGIVEDSLGFRARAADGSAK